MTFTFTLVDYGHSIGVPERTSWEIDLFEFESMEFVVWSSNIICFESISIPTGLNRDYLNFIDIWKLIGCCVYILNERNSYYWIWKRFRSWGSKDWTLISKGEGLLISILIRKLNNEDCVWVILILVWCTIESYPDVDG